MSESTRVYRRLREVAEIGETLIDSAGNNYTVIGRDLNDDHVALLEITPKSHRPPTPPVVEEMPEEVQEMVDDARNDVKRSDGVSSMPLKAARSHVWLADRVVELERQLAGEQWQCTRVSDWLAESRGQLQDARDALQSSQQRAEQEKGDAARYRFLRDHLETDGEVDDCDMATRFYSWLKIKDENIYLPDAYGWSSIDEAIDAAITARSTQRTET